MKAKILLFIPALIFLTLSCEKENAISMSTCTIGFGQSSSCDLEDLNIFFQRVEDSRCPIGATCVWQGEVLVDLLVNDELATMTLNVDSPELAFDTIGNFILELKAVLPLPELDVEIPEGDIEIEIEVNR